MARMPNRNQRLAAEAQKRAEANKKLRYFVLSPNAEFLGDHRLTDEEKENGVDLTEKEAAFFIASGAISTKNPERNKRAAEIVEAHEGQTAFTPPKKGR